MQILTLKSCMLILITRNVNINMKLVDKKFMVTNNHLHVMTIQFDDS